MGSEGAQVSYLNQSADDDRYDAHDETCIFSSKRYNIDSGHDRMFAAYQQE